MNRGVAASKGFQFFRITPTSHDANSSGGFSEEWGAALHGTREQTLRNGRRDVSIRYADRTELMPMLDLKFGGGVTDAVNEGQRLIRRTNA